MPFAVPLEIYDTAPFVNPVAISPDGAHSWMEASRGSYDVITVQELHEPWMHAKPGAAAPLPGAGHCFAAVPDCLRGVFARYWEQHGGLPVYGYPISEPFQEPGADGQTYLVQYFECNRLEYHPEARGSATEIQLGLLGSQAYAQVYGSAPPLKPNPALAPDPVSLAALRLKPLAGREAPFG